MHMKMYTTMLLMSFAGLLFSGYYAGTKLFTDTCAFNETCPLFLGYPACYFGFTMFLLLAGASAGSIFWPALRVQAVQVVRAVSILGILFAGYFTAIELPVLFTEGVGVYLFGLPTCAIGLLVYAAIAWIAFRLEN